MNINKVFQNKFGAILTFFLFKTFYYCIKIRQTLPYKAHFIE